MTDTTEDAPEFDFDAWCRDALGAVVAEQRGGFITRCAVYVEYLDGQGGDPSFIIGSLPESTLMDAHSSAAFLERYLGRMLDMQLSASIMKNHLGIEFLGDEDD